MLARCLSVLAKSGLKPAGLGLFPVLVLAVLYCVEWLGLKPCGSVGRAPYLFLFCGGACFSACFRFNVLATRNQFAGKMLMNLMALMWGLPLPDSPAVMNE
jgi:hypothetical protein